MRRALRALAPLAGLAALMLLVSPARAQDDQDAETRARELFERAGAAFDQGLYPEARELLEESLTLVPRPATVLNLARVYRSMGDLLAAEELLDQLLDGEFGAVDDERRTSAAALRDDVRREIATLIVSVLGTPDAEIRVDGQLAGRASEGAPATVRVDPGEHLVSARSDDGARAERTLDLGPGERRELGLELVAPAAPTEEDRGGGGGVLSSPWFWVIAGVLVAGGAATAIVLATMDRTADPIESEAFPIAEVLTASF